MSARRLFSQMRGKPKGRLSLACLSLAVSPVFLVFTLAIVSNLILAVAMPKLGLGC